MEMCRACLSTEVELVPMNEKFLAKYNILTNLHIKMEDKTLYTCSTCFDGARFCFEFREKCIKADQTLKEFIMHKIIPTKETDEENLIVKNEIKTEDSEDDDAELIDDCYNYGEDYIEPTTEPKVIKPQIRKSKRYNKKEKKEVVVDTKMNCGLCPTILKSKDELTDHLEKHKTDFACSLCNKSFISIPHIFGHRMKHLEKEEKLCHICNKKFISPENLEFHYMRVHEMADKDAPILCKECLKPFVTVRKLLSHLACHAELKFKCDHCSKRFLRLKNLRIHIMGKHISKPSFKCELCDFTSHYNSGIASHKIKKHTVGRVACKTCGRYFPAQEKLDKHECKHRQPVICPICGITFQAKGKLTFKDHMRKHKQPTYKCTHCPSEFKSRSGFRTHMDRHSGKPRFRCKICNRDFYNHPCLIKHNRIHTGEKPYVCKICSRGFTGNHNLKVHMKVHGIYNLIKKKISLSRSVTVCYICYAQLQRCCKFADMAWKSEVVLSELIDKGVKITQEVVTLIGRAPPYLVTPIDYFYNGLRNPSQQVVKEEQVIAQKEVKNFAPQEKDPPAFEILKEILINKIVTSNTPETQTYPSASDIVKEVKNYPHASQVVKEVKNYPHASQVVKIEPVEIKAREVNLRLEANNQPSTSQIIKQEDGDLEVEFQNNVTNENEVVKLESNYIEETWLVDDIGIEVGLQLNDIKSEDMLEEYVEYNNFSEEFEHENDTKPITQDHTCDICSRTFKSKRQIQNHITAHTENKLYLCRLCGKGFREKRYLKEHIKVHTGEKLYNCHFCGYLFTDRSSLNRHLKLHSNSKENTVLKTHECNICNKKFQRHYHLTAHMRVHTGYRPFKCNICNHSFSQKGSLNGHMRIHTGEKTHFCSKCNKGFYRNGHLIQHMVVHTKDRPYKCIYCEKRYTTKINLVQHVCKLKNGK